MDRRAGLSRQAAAAACGAACWRDTPGSVIVGAWLRSDRLEVLGVDEGQAAIAESCAWAAGRLPGKAVIVSMELSGAVRYYTAGFQRAGTG